MPSASFLIFAITLGIGLTLVTPEDWNGWRRAGLIISIWSVIGLVTTQTVEKLQ